MKRLKNQAFLLLCNTTTNSVIESYKDLHKATKTLGDSFVLYHKKTQQVHHKIKQLNHVTFTDDVLTQLNYFPIGFNLVPGNNHFPLLQFFLNNPNYDYYWCIEEDVRFSGSWKTFFETFSSISKDFISSHLRTSHEEPEWPWWPSLAHPYSVVPLKDRVRSFNPIYRISNAGLDYIHRALFSHWCGHHEVLFATLLNRAGFKLMDFGGEGQFVLPEFKNKFYISSTPNTQGKLVDGTMRWRPIFKVVGEQKNKLYHPVK